MRHLFFLMFLGIFSFQTWGQEPTIISTENDYNIVKWGKQLCVYVKPGDYIVKPGNYTKIEYDYDHELFRCFKGDGFEITFEDGQKLESEALFVDIKDFDYDKTFKVITTDKKAGYVKKGKMYIQPIYDDITVEAETYFGCCYNFILTQNGKKGLFVDGLVVLDPIYDALELPGQEGQIIIKKDKKIGIAYPRLDAKGKMFIALQPEYDELKLLDTRDGRLLYQLKQDKKYGFALLPSYYDLGEEELFFSQVHVLLKPVLKKVNWKKRFTIEWRCGDLIIVPVNKTSYALISTEGKACRIAEDIIYDDANYSPIAIKNGLGKYQVVSDKDCLSLDTMLYEDVRALSDAIAVKKDGKWQLYQSKSPQFDTFEALNTAYMNGDF
ncbi:MAG: hypothetical protein ACWA41_05985 [Putridiphycobacter sp.]